ncbi:MAG: alpha/beta fold hydrolase [Hyphomicrobiales bacterium]|nr:alpha/beta fold hydrolase [Hyphomicrobiales bacterium]
MALALTLGACASASSGFSDVADQVASVRASWSQPKAAPASVQLFVASTRRKAGEVQDGHARFFLQSVSIPPGHKPGAIEAPRFGAPDPAEHFTLARSRALDGNEFPAELAAHISGRVGNARDVLVYVHGFNTSQAEARFRLAQIVADGGFAGVPVLFTWPSKGELFAYESDKEAATVSRDALEKLLLDLAHAPGVGRVQVLAHSMGAWLTMEALRETAIAGHGDLDGKLGSVMLAAPDIDLAVFRQQVSRLNASHVSVFVSRDDRALSLSSRIAGDRPRLGAMDPSRAADAAAIDAMGVRVYDLSMLRSGFIGHDTYADAPDAVRQIGATLTKKREADADVQAVIGERPDPVQTAPAPINVQNAPIIAEPLPAPAATAAK